MHLCAINKHTHTFQKADIRSHKQYFCKAIKPKATVQRRIALVEISFKKHQIAELFIFSKNSFVVRTIQSESLVKRSKQKQDTAQNIVPSTSSASV